MSFGANVRHWLEGGTLLRELRQMRSRFDQVEAAWQASPLPSLSLQDLVVEHLRATLEHMDRLPATSILVELAYGLERTIDPELTNSIEVDWTGATASGRQAVEIRAAIERRAGWSGAPKRTLAAIGERFRAVAHLVLERLPPSCLGQPEATGTLTVPLIDLVDRPDAFLGDLFAAFYSDEVLSLELFRDLRTRLVANLLMASGFQPDDDAHALASKLKHPTGRREAASDLARMYFGGTPLLDLLLVPVPLDLSGPDRFEHCHIIGGTGHGKTQLLQSLIYADLLLAQKSRRSVVVIDSQGDLIGKLSRLALFDPEVPGSLADRFILIDPADVEYPPALNLFDAGLGRLSTYSAADRERVLNGVIELYEMFFGALLGAELTQKQGVIFKYLARLMLSIKGATIHTLMSLMEDGKPYRADMEKLEGSARHFFATEFFDPSFSATKKQILKRLWGVLATPAFERMFSQPQNKLDLFQAINDGKIILISTAKDLLKQDGSSLFGRFFLGLLAQAALERSTLAPTDRTPTMVYVDEAQEYFDDTFETLLSQARKYHVGLTLAHQALDQLSPRLRAVLSANTSMKCAGGVSAKDARSLAEDLHAPSEFIEGMRRQQTHTEFAVWLRRSTASAVRLAVPLGFLESAPRLPSKSQDLLAALNRPRICGESEHTPDRFGTVESHSEPDLPIEPPPSGTPAAKLEESPGAPSNGLALAMASSSPVAEKQMGKGGQKHRSVQSHIKRLAEEHGFKAVIEAPVGTGQVDVGLYRGELSIACEVTVSSNAQAELEHIRKCIKGGFALVWSVSLEEKRRNGLQSLASTTLSAADLSRVSFILASDVEKMLSNFPEPTPPQGQVRGYRVVTSLTESASQDADSRRIVLARILSRASRTARQPR
ncbi:MAG: type IV secretory system conjugative DNA transfer family protein [Caulobacter sp.]